ncbi:hypothetical protein FisN_23Lh083 [Fistulifera solaris]|uniref:GH16 domain-containing protein n=1 Tax=Fistulifera solaris TaxID=1519565 RepID=A0A1Z5KMP4_FISSO|nr:hypothetical protein FisN_23Lh083 [Fistulifera solaris]|eukprot:GAX27342.1 hypothetical protein FisN_23Lh083 [Fistulifera solaris]
MSFQKETLVPLVDDSDHDAKNLYPSDDDFDDEGLADMMPEQRFEARMAERLSVRLLAISDDDEEGYHRELRKSLRLLRVSSSGDLESKPSATALFVDKDFDFITLARRHLWIMILIAVVGLFIVGSVLWWGVRLLGPPYQPAGPYELIERQEGEDFFQYYTFYEGKDSAGSDGYNMYVNMQKAKDIGIVNVTMESDELDVYQFGGETDVQKGNKDEPFVYMLSAPTPEGPRDSIRLEGIRRFNRGLFIIDVRHMPTGCGVWPAFWLTDEANWPVNGEIDIVEGVNYQSEAKTALHSTKGCSMTDIPLGVMTGTWDTAQGIPDAKTGIPDMTLRYARNCFVYDQHQWLNQGCVAVDQQGGTLGGPLNEKGGGVYALEWDPINRHIRSWVFTPHSTVPENLVQAIRTASLPPEDRIDPDPSLWPIPYAYYAIGDETDCPSSHFRHMRLVFNTAFCGSVAGNRYQMDCPKQAKDFPTCNAWVKSDPDEMKDAYWKVRGVYVYERRWERRLTNY